MAGLNETPSADRVRISFFGRRNAGKSTLVNAITGQEIAIVSDVPGTTTDPVSKAMEILPLGPCLLTDTAGLDDEGPLGEERVRRSLEVLSTTDVAVWVGDPEQEFQDACARRGVPVLIYRRGDDVEALKRQIAAVRLAEEPPPLLKDLVEPGDTVACVCPIDESAPKGRLILPQQQVVRELLDAGCSALVCQPGELSAHFAAGRRIDLVVTDSQAFKAVDAVVPRDVPLTSFSILFARQKGDLAAYRAGVDAIHGLKDGDRVLVAEGCTHHRQCNDIGTTKIPRALARLTGGRKLDFTFCSGASFPFASPSADGGAKGYALVVHCGGCMLARRVVQDRIAACREADVPIVNYGMLLAAANGMRVAPEGCLVLRDVSGSQSA
ncbi:MAG: 50S ribosome-binding GTPase [Kiritimatiellae bacterium]|nr:50S ribosome-binding GTPase [Kiritimatiellia bacterium]